MFSRDALIAQFHTYGVPRGQWRVGLELERHLLRPDGHPVPYPGEDGVQGMIERMAPHGWKTKHEGPHPIALHRGLASVTLEPGSQWEYSTAPHADVAGCAAEAVDFIDATRAAIGHRPITPVALGYTPFATVDEIPWVPKGRYVVMREHLGATGPLAHHMMKSTCATQASFDFADEADAARKLRLTTWMAPLTTAIFANSPLTGGRPNGFMSFRGHVWTQTDPRRTGLPDAATEFTFERWVDYLLDVPMMFLYDDARGWRAAGGASFRRWMAEGLDGHFPDEAAWDLHLTSVFPEVRVKRLIEIRGADCVNHDLAMAFGALFEGLLYDDAALDAATEVAAAFAHHGDARHRFEIANREGLAGNVGGRTLAAWAESLVDLARGGLARARPGDVALLAPLVDQVATGESPAARVLRLWSADPRPAALIAQLQYQAGSIS